MFLLMKLRKRSKNNSEVGYGVKLTNDPKKLESAQVELNRSSLVSEFPVKDLGSSPLAIDAVLFTGGSRDGTYLIISAARRPERTVQCIVMLHVPGLGLLEHSRHPDTAMIQVDTRGAPELFMLLRSCDEGLISQQFLLYSLSSHDLRNMKT